MAWLGEELPGNEQDGATRCVKDVLEEDLFAHRRDLLTTLDVVFMDATSLYFEGAGGKALGRRGFSKDHRPDLNQMILAVLVDGDGRPVCAEMWPGNTADVGSLIPGRYCGPARACASLAKGCVRWDTRSAAPWWASCSTSLITVCNPIERRGKARTILIAMRSSTTSMIG